MASCKMPFNPDKADLYHQKAKEAGKKAGCGWVENFYSTFEESAGNFRVKEEYFPRVEYIRKAGVAMLQWYELKRDNILPEKSSKHDEDFWKRLFMEIDTGSTGFLKKRTEEQGDCLCHQARFSSYALACWYYKNAMQKELIDQGNDIIKAANKLSANKEDEYSMSLYDTSLFINGYVNLIGGGRFVDVLPNNSRSLGWNKVWLSANRGCMPALHFLADLFDSDMGKEVRASGANFYDIDEEKVRYELLHLLELSYAKNDSGAMRRIQVLKP